VETIQQRLIDGAIEFCAIKPGSLHLNGKIERLQPTGRKEVLPNVDPCHQAACLSCGGRVPPPKPLPANVQGRINDSESL
jgi:hypothetical protein